MDKLAENLEAVRERIAKACERAARSPSEVTLVGVTKNHPPEVIAEAVRHGLSILGENRVQEAKAKIPLCPGRVEWHMIGHLQSNKARDAVELFSMIQSIDSLHLAQEVNRRAEQASRHVRVLAEVNMAGESSKFGYKPEQFLAELEQLNALPRIEIHGLMTVAPYTPTPERVRPIFARMRELKLAAETRLGAPLPHLSMGMSGDFEVAIEEGATMVRLGTILFGERQKTG